MSAITRRAALALAAGGLAGGAALRPAAAAIPVADVPPMQLPIEAGATLRVLRPAKYVDADETVFRANTRKYTEATGVPVRVDFVGFEDVRPQTAVSANTGAGPDIVIGWPDDPHIYTAKLVELTDVAEYLGAKYGGWLFLPARYGKQWGTNRWIGLPMGGGNGPIVYRISWVKEAGFDAIPTDLEGFLALCRKLKAIGHPPGFALGNSVGDASGYAQWLLWAHGGSLVDEEGRVTLNRPETVAALEYAKALQQTFVSGTLSWLDPSNNKAYAAGDISLTANGVSIYYALKNNPATAAMAADTNHAHLPSGVVGKPPETSQVLNAMVFRYSRFPNAAKDYLRFMMEVEQYDTWLTQCLGYWAQPLKAYASSAVWSSDPKLLVYRDACASEFWNGYKGPITAASGAVAAEYVLVHMFAAVASGSATPQEAIREAERRARRYYKA
jgi:multiple sugar transport system substrate-binding protein